MNWPAETASSKQQAEGQGKAWVGALVFPGTLALINVLLPEGPARGAKRSHSSGTG
jgi:hypothetical protein